MNERIRPMLLALMRLALVMGLLIVAGACARRPALTAASAPAPGAPGSGPATTPSTASTPAPAETPAPVAAAPPAVTPRPAPPEFAANDTLKRIHFDFDKSDIRKADAAILDANARWLKDNPRQQLLVEGHCDPRGTNEYNLALGERRARSTMKYLVDHGVAAARITVITYGEERPLCVEETEDCWARNRRAMFLTKPQ